MQKANSGGFGSGSMEPMIIIALIMVGLGVLIPILKAYRTTSPKELAALVAEEIKGEENTDKTGSVAEKPTAMSVKAPLLRVEDDTLVIDRIATELPDLGSTLKLSLTQSAVYTESKVVLREKNDWFSLFVLFPAGCLVGLLVSLAPLVFYIIDRRKGERPKLMGYLVATMVGLTIASLCLWGIMYEREVTVSGSTITAGSDTVKVEGFALFKDQEQLFAFCIDEDGELFCMLLAQKCDNLSSLTATLNGLIADSKLKRFFEVEP